MATSTTKTAASSGISMGTALAMIVTWSNGQDMVWTVIHGIFGWVYIIFYAFGGR